MLKKTGIFSARPGAKVLLSACYGLSEKTDEEGGGIKRTF